MRPLELYQLKRDGPCPCVFSFKVRALTKGACCRFLNLACSREPGRLIPRIGEKVEDLLNRSLDEDLTLSRNHATPRVYRPTADAEENSHDYRALEVCLPTSPSVRIPSVAGPCEVGAYVVRDVVKAEAPIVVGFCIYWGYLMTGTAPTAQRTNVYIHS